MNQAQTQEAVEWMRDEIAYLESQLTEVEEERDVLAQRVHEAYEVFANMTGDDFRSVTALNRVIKAIVGELK